MIGFLNEIQIFIWNSTQYRLKGIDSQGAHLFIGCAHALSISFYVLFCFVFVLIISSS